MVQPERHDPPAGDAQTHLAVALCDGVLEEDLRAVPALARGRDLGRAVNCRLDNAVAARTVGVADVDVQAHAARDRVVDVGLLVPQPHCCNRLRRACRGPAADAPLRACALTTSSQHPAAPAGGAWQHWAGEAVQHPPCIL